MLLLLCLWHSEGCQQTTLARRLTVSRKGNDGDAGGASGLTAACAAASRRRRPGGLAAYRRGRGTHRVVSTVYGVDIKVTLLLNYNFCWLPGRVLQRRVRCASEADGDREWQTINKKPAYQRRGEEGAFFPTESALLKSSPPPDDWQIQTPIAALTRRVVIIDDCTHLCDMWRLLLFRPRIEELDWRVKMKVNSMIYQRELLSYKLIWKERKDLYDNYYTHCIMGTTLASVAGNHQ